MLDLAIFFIGLKLRYDLYENLESHESKLTCQALVGIFPLLSSEMLVQIFLTIHMCQLFLTHVFDHFFPPHCCLGDHYVSMVMQEWLEVP
jgi:hypothetical protein